MKTLLGVALLAGVCLALPAAAQQAPKGPGMSGYLVGEAPRFQIYEAPRPYGGLLMVDTKTGETWQRIIVTTPQGIAIRWLKLERQGLQPGETILWD